MTVGGSEVAQENRPAVMSPQLWERLKVRGEEKMRGHRKTGWGHVLRNRMCVHAGQGRPRAENLKKHTITHNVGLT